MALTINTNIASLRAQGSLGTSQSRLAKSFQRLSSGFRINSASDDAAGLGISESLNAKVRSFAVAERNTMNAISMATTAEGTLGQMSGIIIRMRELAVQSANGDLTETDRGFLDTEFQLLALEIDRLSESTQFNGIDLLGGKDSRIDYQVGIDTTSFDIISVDFGGLSTRSLGIGVGPGDGPGPGFSGLSGGTIVNAGNMASTVNITNVDVNGFADVQNNDSSSVDVDGIKDNASATVNNNDSSSVGVNGVGDDGFVNIVANDSANVDVVGVTDNASATVNNNDSSSTTVAGVSGNGFVNILNNDSANVSVTGVVGNSSVTVNNNDSSSVTVSDVSGDGFVNIQNGDSSTITVSGITTGGSVTIDNVDSSDITISGVGNANVSITADASGFYTITDISGGASVTLDNNASGTYDISKIADGASITFSGQAAQTENVVGTGTAVDTVGVGTNIAGSGSASALAAIDTLDAALTALSTRRATLGATSNRLNPPPTRRRSGPTSRRPRAQSATSTWQRKPRS